MAAAVAAVVTVNLRKSDALYLVEGTPGEMRSIALEDGSSIKLNGAARIELSRSDQRFARVEGGEALFTVVHDPSRPFRVEAGNTSIQDLGTVFNVDVSGNAVDVSVAEGEVRFSAAGRSVDLKPGMAAAQVGGEISVSSHAIPAVAGWSKGRLQYSETPLAEIADDLAKAAGVAVVVDRSLRDRRFTGSLSTNGNNEELRARVAALLDVEIRPSNGRWVLAARRS